MVHRVGQPLRELLSELHRLQTGGKRGQALTNTSGAGQLALDPSRRCGISAELQSEFGTENFRLSQVHVGSGYRMRQVLAKAARGEKLTVGVLGGSGQSSLMLSDQKDG